jgi:hypothetical protein
MTIVVIIVLSLVLLVAIVLAVASTRPDSFEVHRAIDIKATPATIAPLINDFHAWTRWSPWEDRDPALKRTYEGAESGTGAIYSWVGNRNVGSGRMEVLEATLNRILIKLDFLAPFKAHNTAEFALAPTVDGTRVTWMMRGPSPLITKVMGLFMNMDRMIGPDFEAGLAKLKAAAEQG